MRRTLFLLVTAGVLHSTPIESVCTLTWYSAETTTQTVVRGAGCSIESDGAIVRDESYYGFGVNGVFVSADLYGRDNRYLPGEHPDEYVSVIGTASTVIEHSYVLRTTGPVRKGAMLFDSMISQGYGGGGYVEIDIGHVGFSAEECEFGEECIYFYAVPWTLGVPFTVSVRAGASHNSPWETEWWSAGAGANIHFQPAELGRCPEGELSPDCIALIEDGVYFVPEPGTASLLLAASVCFGLLGISRRLHIEG